MAVPGDCVDGADGVEGAGAVAVAVPGLVAFSEGAGAVAVPGLVDGTGLSGSGAASAVALDGVNGSGPEAATGWRNTSPPAWSEVPLGRVSTRARATTAATATSAVASRGTERHHGPRAGGPPELELPEPPGGAGGDGGGGPWPPPESGPDGGPVGRPDEGGGEDGGCAGGGCGR